MEIYNYPDNNFASLELASVTVEVLCLLVVEMKAVGLAGYDLAAETVDLDSPHIVTETVVFVNLQASIPTLKLDYPSILAETFESASLDLTVQTVAVSCRKVVLEIY
jgi:hypothetical protein